MYSPTINRFKFSICSSSSLDNFIYKLCYRWTVLLLVAFSLVVTCRLWIGDSFRCMLDDHMSLWYAMSSCYGYTYILPTKTFNVVTNHLSVNYSRYQSYYPWVNLVLLIHAFNFYLPHLLWKSYESGYMLRLTAGVQNCIDKEENRGLELCYLAKYVLVSQGKHKLYTYLYVFFEACNCVVALAQTVCLVHFFDVTGVPDFMSIKLVTWSDFEKFYFPKSGKCFFEYDDINKMVQCSLPMNRLYMYLFLFLHTWYIAIMILTGMVVIYRISLLVPSFRMFATRTSLAERSVLKSLCHRLSYSDWLFLTRLQKSMTDVDFAQMLDKLAIVAQDQDPHLDLDQRSSSFMDAMKYFENSDATSPL